MTQTCTTNQPTAAQVVTGCAFYYYHQYTVTTSNGNPSIDALTTNNYICGACLPGYSTTYSSVVDNSITANTTPFYKAATCTAITNCNTNNPGKLVNAC